MCFSAHCFANFLNLIIAENSKKAPGTIPQCKSKNTKFKKICEVVRKFGLELRNIHVIFFVCLGRGHLMEQFLPNVKCISWPGRSVFETLFKD